MLSSLNFLKSGDEGFVDLSNALEFEPEDKGCLGSVAVKGKPSRLQISKNLYADLGEPKAVRVLFVDRRLALIPADLSAPKAVKLGKEPIIYDAALTQKTVDHFGVTTKDSGTTRFGSYHMQECDDGTLAAIVSVD